MDPKRLFRAAALEKLSSPERLDVMMQVTSPVAWLALTSLGAVLLILIVWSIVGTMAIKVNGKGILLSGGTVHRITAGGSARIAEVLVEEGDVIYQGDVLVRMSQPHLNQQVENARGRLAETRLQAARDNPVDSTRIVELERQREQQVEALATVRNLQSRGLATAQQVQQAGQVLSGIDSQIISVGDRIAGRRRSARDQERELNAVQTQLANSEALKSPHTGRVIAVDVVSGDQVGPGILIAIVEPIGDIESVLYISASDGKKVKPGMRAQISPSHVRVEEWGFMIGEVSSVSDFPVGQERLKKILGNPQLASDLAGRSAPYEVKIKLTKDESTESGFKWSSSKGPPVDVVSGTVCGGNITVDRKKPISYVLPIFRKALGAG